MNLNISGLGILIYSPFAAEHIRNGEDYLSKKYLEPGDVLRHVFQGTLVGFGTGSPGTFFLNLASGYPPEPVLRRAQFKLRLAVEVRSQTLCFRDLEDLAAWVPDCPAGQSVKLQDGIYHVSIHSDMPPSDVLGDNQTIWVYLNRLEAMPALRFEGVPSLI